LRTEERKSARKFSRRVVSENARGGRKAYQCWRAQKKKSPTLTHGQINKKKKTNPVKMEFGAKGSLKFTRSLQTKGGKSFNSAGR